MKLLDLSFLCANIEVKEDLMVLMTIREIVLERQKQPLPIFPIIKELCEKLSKPYNQVENLNPILERLLEQKDILKNLVVTMEGAAKIHSYLQMKRNHNKSCDHDEVFTTKTLLTKYKKSNNFKKIPYEKSTRALRKSFKKS